MNTAIFRRAFTALMFCTASTYCPCGSSGQEPAFSVAITAVDAETQQPIAEFSVVPAPWRENSRHVTWQRQYRQQPDTLSGLFTMNRGWKETVLRIEAAGYRTEITSPLPRQAGQTLTVKLEKDPGTKGIVLTPEGDPAMNAAVAVCTWTREVTVENGTIRYMRDRGDELRHTQADGGFALPTEPDEWVLVVAHESGYAERTAAELAESSRVTLQPWGRLQGRAVVDGQPVSDLKIDLGSGRGDVDVVLHYAGQATTDQDGNFVADRLPPVSLYVSPVFRTGETEHKLLWFSGLTRIKPGVVTEVTVPRPGQRIRGRIAMPDDSDLTLKDVALDVRCILRPPSISGVREHVNSAYAAYSELMASEFGNAFRRANIPVNDDGTFEINDLPETTYTIQVSARQKNADPASRPVAFHAERVTLKAAAPEDPVTDLGELQLRKT